MLALTLKMEGLMVPVKPAADAFMHVVMTNVYKGLAIIFVVAFIVKASEYLFYRIVDSARARWFRRH
jgi:hypothetical protein